MDYGQAEIFKTRINISPFSAYVTKDKYKRRIIFYLSPAKIDNAPIALFVQGSGCHSAFRINKEGELRGGYQNVLHKTFKGLVNLIVVEKPGVKFLDDSTCGGTAECCSKTFHREHTLTKWVEALEAALKATRHLLKTVNARLIIIGHSEGGVVAARLAATENTVTHIAILSGSGPTQLFDLIENARLAIDQKTTMQERVENVYRTFLEIQADPQNSRKFAWGHPYRRWSSFLETSTLHELLQTKARIFIAHGEKDNIIPLTAFVAITTELLSQGRDLTAQLYLKADHSFRVEENLEIDPMIFRPFKEIFNWFTEAGTKSNEPVRFIG